LRVADGIRKKRVREYIPREKTLQSYPAFLIGRFGVSQEFNRQGVGTQLLDFIKTYCIGNYPDFCRFLVIDAYNILLFESKIFNFPLMVENFTSFRFAN